MANTSHFHGICQFHLESIQNVQKYDIPQDYVSWHFIFPIKSAENRSHFVFCPGKIQNWKKKKKKKEEKIIIFMKFMEKEVKKVGSRRIWSYDQKNCLVLPTSSYTLSKTAHVNYYKILYLTFLKLFLQRNI